MSIVTLKKKTQAKYNNLSVGEPSFSLNGGYRNQGYIGQTSLSRSLPRTLARGNTLRGYGGCCGTFRLTPSVLSAVTSVEDNRIIKSSVLDYDGMSAIKYQWIRRPNPITVVKSDSNNNNTTAQHYIDYLNKLTVQKVNTLNENVVKTNIICNGKCAALPYNVGGSLYKKNVVTITKPISDYTPQSQGDYLINLKKKCVDHYIYCNATITANSNLQPKQTQRTPLPSGIVPFSCNGETKTKTTTIGGMVCKI